MIYNKLKNILDKILLINKLKSILQTNNLKLFITKTKKPIKKHCRSNLIKLIQQYWKNNKKNINFAIAKYNETKPYFLI